MTQTTNQKITVTCLPGLETLLAEEIEVIGAKEIEVGRRAVMCTGDLNLIYNLNIKCRFALRVLLHMEKHDVRHEEDMYRAVRGIKWSSHFDVKKTFAVRAAFGRHKFKNTHYFALKAKDGIVDQFMESVESRPSIDTKTPDVGIYLFYDSGELDIYLDSSGYSLHKRGYKQHLGQASINETLAAAVFKWSGWTPGKTVINPMCGVGTLGIEAAFAMNNLSPQIQRLSFGFQHWFNYDSAAFDSIKKEAQLTSSEEDVLCSDIDRRAVDDCRSNVDHAELSNFIHCDVEDFFEMECIEDSIILLNPPYDKRIKELDVVGFYRQIGDTLKFKWKNCTCVIISGNLDAFKFVGLRPNKKYKVFNGPIPAEVRLFDIY